MHGIRCPNAIARTFSANLLREIGRSDLAEVIRLNGTAEYAGNWICATHDFCDANMPMAQAFESVVAHEPDCGSDEDATLWNQAWEIARDNRFFLPNVD